MRALFVVFVAILLGCNVPPGPVAHDASTTDAAVGDADLPGAACAKLRAVGCPLGSSKNCRKVFGLDPKFGADPACVLSSEGGSLSACGVTCE